MKKSTARVGCSRPFMMAVCSIALLTSCGGKGSPAAPTTSTTSAASIPPATPALLPAQFQISFSADSACTALPAVARTRTYSATTNGNGSPYLIELANATFGGGSYLWHTIYADVSGENARMFFQDPPIWEQLPSDQYLVIFGIEAGGPIRELPATLSFAGDFTFCAVAGPDSYPECEVPEIVCRSSEHRLTVARQ